tara:strand:- start:31 stop:186 length:156 start_codon:yes stop_codon:yes gene_type:complete
MLHSFLLLLLVAIVLMIASLLVLVHKVKDVEQRINSGEIQHWTDRSEDGQE